MEHHKVPFVIKVTLFQVILQWTRLKQSLFLKNIRIVGYTHFTISSIMSSFKMLGKKWHCRISSSSIFTSLDWAFKALNTLTNSFNFLVLIVNTILRGVNFQFSRKRDYPFDFRWNIQVGMLTLSRISLSKLIPIQLCGSSLHITTFSKSN